MTSFQQAEQTLMEAALRYPETHEANPWGHRVAKVKGKAFVFLGGEQDRAKDGTLQAFSATFKLPQSSGMALMLPFAEPTGYGMARSGWVTARFTPGQDVPVSLLLRWLDESFEAVAPKRLLQAYRAAASGGAPAAPVKGPAARKSATKEPAAKRPAAKKAVAKAPAARKAVAAVKKAAAAVKKVAPKKRTAARR
jgi:predicted DNA-binding protein (MmcQ/YjbR family)